MRGGLVLDEGFGGSEVQYYVGGGKMPRYDIPYLGGGEERLGTIAQWKLRGPALRVRLKEGRG